MICLKMYYLVDLFIKNRLKHMYIESEEQEDVEKQAELLLLLIKIRIKFKKISSIFLILYFQKEYIARFETFIDRG